jgi:isopentenyl phosphate kinase
MNPMAINPTPQPNLYFVKLGGSLITDKTIPSSPRKDVIARLAREIFEAKEQNRNLKLLLGHGSGSFGHIPAQKYGTRHGVRSQADWKGFSQVWFEASTLNRLVIEALHIVGLQAVSFPISASATIQDGLVNEWNLNPIESAFDADLLPVVFGDVAFDTIRGGTIFSTEEIFSHLARAFKPKRILIAGIDDAVYADYPRRNQPIPEISPRNWEEISPMLEGANTVDVTGGMRTKVESMMVLTAEVSGLEVQIFSGNQTGNLFAVLNGKLLGTRISQ